MNYSDWECRDLAMMYAKYGFPVATQPTLIDPHHMDQRINHISEELTELVDAHDRGNIHEIADALVDLVVLVKGTAVMMGLPWESLWREVHRANSSKVVGVNPKRPDHKHDLVKPEDWVAPRIDQVLNGSL